MNASILIADDHAVVRKGLRALLEARPDWKICGEACDGRQAIRMASELQPDVVILDISMPGLNGLEATAEISKACSGAKILILTMHYSEDFVERSLKAGARGYLLKSDAENDLLAAVEALIDNKLFLTPPASELMLGTFLNSRQDQTALQSPLTVREREILQLIAEGSTNKEIADRLCVSTRTVETHRAHIMSKLKLDSIPELVRYAIRNKIVEA
jgi:DNA-binding NarL/FixJ family response regulator